MRLLREGGTDVACALRVPMGQFFGGRSVAMMGVAGVAVAPEARGRGLATRVMQEVLREAREEGGADFGAVPGDAALVSACGV